ncbi:FAD-dependent oxidoreductase, partial [Streptomyces sp. MBRL 601]
RPVLDDGRYRAALAAGRPDWRPLFTGADGAKLVWPDGSREEVDAIVLATGYRPDSLRGVGRDVERIARRLAARLARR